LGGKYTTENVAWLTPEEHYVAHQILVKLHPSDKKLIYAAYLMTIHDTDARSPNKLYGWVRRSMAQITSTRMRGEWSLNRDKMLAGVRRNHISKEDSAQYAKESWTRDTGHRRDQIRTLQRETNATTAQRNRELWQTPEYQERMTCRRRGSNSQSMKALWANPIRKQQMLDARNETIKNRTRT
jgi:hypothetical protein